MKRFVAVSVCIVAPLFVSLPCGYAQEGAFRFEPSGCPIDIPSDPYIDCGYLIVPEDRGDPESR